MERRGKPASRAHAAVAPALAGLFRAGRVRRLVAHGFDVEVVSVDALRQIDSLAIGADRAHVTSYIAWRPREFRLATIGLLPSSVDLRVTLDEPADADLLDAVVAELGDRANDWRAVVELLHARPDLTSLNAHVGVKPISAG
jgi:spore coat polysaccharide biosynthesis protein SpsF